MQTNYEIGVKISAESAKSAARSIGQADAALNKMSRSASSASSTLASFGGNVAASAFSNISSLAVDAGAAVLSYSAQMEQTKIGFDSLIGNAQLAQKHLADLKQFAISTPFEFEGLAKASQRLQSVGVDTAKTIPLMKDLGNIVAATGDISAERFDGITTAIAQMISKTKISAEEMEQLSERGVPAWKLLSDATGKSQTELRKLSEQGKLSSDVMVAALSKISKEKFGDAMEKQSRTFNGALSNIGDFIKQESEKWFAPVYSELTKFSVKFAESLQETKQRSLSASQTFGFALGEAMGEAYKRGVASQIDNGSGVPIILPGAQNNLLQSIASFSAATVLGAQKGINSQKSIADLRKMDDTVGQISSKVFNMKSLPIQLGAATAEKETKALSDTFDDLTNKITFFGDASEVAATKQKLISAGITDFSQGQAKNIIKLAQGVDSLKKIQKEQEDYNKSLKDSRDYLKQLRDNASFNISFPEPTALNKFDTWVKQQAVNFRGLQTEIKLTRQFLQIDENMKELNERISAGKEGIAGLDAQIEALSVTVKDSFKDAVKDFAQTIGILKSTTEIKDDFGINVTLTAFTEKVKNYTDAYETFLKTADSKSWQDAEESLRSYLNSFKLASGNRVFTDKGVDDFITRIRRLAVVVSDKNFLDATERVDKLIESVSLDLRGLSKEAAVAITPLDKLNKELSDPNIQTALEARANALGITVEKLKELIRIASTGVTMPDISLQLEVAATRPKISDWLGLEGIEDKKEIYKNTVTELKDITVNAFGQMANAVGSAIEGWVLYGDSIGESLQRATAAVLANIAAQSAVKAIYELAEGFALLFVNPAASSAHFTAAAIYGGIAAGSALVGRAIAPKDKGASSSTSQNSPDYQIATGSSSGGLLSTNQNLLTSGSSAQQNDNQIAQALRDLNNRLDSVPPEHVLKLGVKRSGTFITDVTISQVKNSSTKKKDLGTALRLK